MTDQLDASICQLYKKEILSVLEREKISDLNLKYYPPICYGFSKTTITEGSLPKKIQQFGDTTLLDSCLLYQKKTNQFVSGDLNPSKVCRNCLQTLVSNSLLEYFTKEGGYLVSPGWLDHWKTILKNWGFDQAGARMFFQESTKKIIFLDTGVDSNAKEKVSDFASYIDLPFQIVPVGIDYFQFNIHTKLQAWKDQQKSSYLKQAQEHAANYALAFDMLTSLSNTKDEKELIDELLNIVRQLFSPREISYVSLSKENPEYFVSLLNEHKEDRKLLKWMRTSRELFEVENSKDGFFLKIRNQDEILGGIGVYQLSFPQYLTRYLNLGLHISPIIGLAISNLRNIKKIEEHETLLENLASTDALTGIYNRRFFINEAEKEFARVERFGSSLSALLMDIDHFKLINDTYGHQVGDEVLIKFTKLLSQSLRKTDLFFRLGSDEFIILLPETNLDMALIFAERVKKILEKFSLSFEEKTIQITSSMGVVELNKNMKTVDEFLAQCDQALYRAKIKGRNRIESSQAG